jgi:hypothetical protein
MPTTIDDPTDKAPFCLGQRLLNEVTEVIVSAVFNLMVEEA